MATSQGIVTKIGSGKAWVKSQKSHACAACSAKNSCNPTGCDQDIEVEAINLVGAKEGDRVVIAFENSSLIKLAFFLYIFPIISLLAGALAGQAAAPFLKLSPSMFSALCGFLCFFASVIVIKLKGDKLSQLREYTPKITRFISRHV